MSNVHFDALICPARIDRPPNLPSANLNFHGMRIFGCPVCLVSIQKTLSDVTHQCVPWAQCTHVTSQPGSHTQGIDESASVKYTMQKPQTNKFYYHRWIILINQPIIVIVHIHNFFFVIDNSLLISESCEFLHGNYHVLPFTFVWITTVHTTVHTMQIHRH